MLLSLLIQAASFGATIVPPGPCPSQPLPSPFESAGFSRDAWPDGETIRFSASPAFERISWVVEINRPRDHREPGRVRVLKLQRQWACNRHDLLTEWRMPLAPADATRIFQHTQSLEDIRQPDYIVMDGTGFQYERHIEGRLYEARLVSDAQGRSGLLSSVILNLVRSFAEGSVPTSADWRSE